MFLLILGYLLAPAVKKPNELLITVYLVSLIVAVGACYFSLSPFTVNLAGIQLPLGFIFAAAITLGSIGLFIFRYLYEEGRKFDSLLVLVMMVNTAINLIYFLWGSAV